MGDRRLRSGAGLWAVPLHKGLTQAEVEKLAGPLKPAQPGIFTAQRVPKPDSGFPVYALVVTPGHGLCAIRAAGKLVEIDMAGTQIQAAFAARKEMLARTYGESKVTDGLRKGSALNKPTDWAMALAKQKREQSATWTLKSNQSGISIVMLEAGGASGSKGQPG